MAGYYNLQDKARLNIKKLIMLFFGLILFISILMSSLTYWLIIMFDPSSKLDESAYEFSIWVAISFFVILFFSFLGSNYYFSSDSGEKIAKLLNARKIIDSKDQYMNSNNKEKNSSNIHDYDLAFKEKQLYNIVAEISIASAFSRIPEVYVIDDENSINAMCAGVQASKITIIVTKGALLAFNREQMQGVIGHEFSHVINQDVKFNIKLISIIFGLSAIVLIGEHLFHFNARYPKSGDWRYIIVGFVFYFLGGIGMFFAQLIQAKISRQKEFLADATAVQFTSNKEGIIQALEIIGDLGLHAGYLKNTNSQLMSHMFFAKSKYEIFATHPSIEERIEALK